MLNPPKPRKARKPKLPPVPTGFELVDLEWASMAPEAEALLAELPLRHPIAGGPRTACSSLSTLAAR